MSEKDEMSTEFTKVIKDFVKDLFGTFSDKINKDQHSILISIITENEVPQEIYKNIYKFCKETYPKIFFDILYQNEELFGKDKETNLLPGLNFTELWHSEISVTTKATIWKYLQLILFSVVSNVDSHKSFGDTAKLFEAINQDEFKQKIEETISHMEDIFKTSPDISGGDTSSDVSNNDMPNFNQIPNAADLHSHINQMMEGKLGCLAKEIAEETAQDFNIDSDNANSVNDVFKQLLKNPGKLMGLVQSVGSKLDTKIKSGAIKESELLEEASNMVNNMKNMPGMDNLESMFSKMGMGGMGGKMDMGAMQRHMAQNLRGAKTRDRMRTKLSEKTAAAQETSQNAMNPLESVMNDLGISMGEETEKTPRSSKKKKKRPKGLKK